MILKIQYTYFIFLSMLIFFLACNENKNDSKNLFDYKHEIKQDTIIRYDFEGVSSEGAVAKVRYKKNQINSANVIIYGESGKAELQLLFSEKYIKVNESVYMYKKNISEIATNDDIILISTSVYKLKDEGVLIGVAKDRQVDIFDDVIKQIPRSPRYE